MGSCVRNLHAILVHNRGEENVKLQALEIVYSASTSLTSARALDKSSELRTRLSLYPAAFSCFLLLEPSLALQSLPRQKVVCDRRDVVT